MIVFRNLKYSSCKLLTDIPLDKEGVYVVDTMQYNMYMDQTLQSNYISCNSENIYKLKLNLATPSTRCYLMQCISFLIVTPKTACSQVTHKPTNFVTSRLKRINASYIETFISLNIC